MSSRNRRLGAATAVLITGAVGLRAPSAYADGDVDPEMSVSCSDHVFDGGVDVALCLVKMAGSVGSLGDSQYPSGQVTFSSTTGSFVNSTRATTPSAR